MKKLALLLLLGSVFFISSTHPQEKYRIINQNSFGKNEHIEYLVHYGAIHGGVATIDVSKNLYRVNGRPCYKIEVFGRSTGGLEMVTKIRDLWVSYVDTASISTHKFYRNILEGNYKKEETTVFNPTGKSATISDEKGTRNFITPEYVQDMVSGFYFIRTLDFDKYQSGDVITVPGVLESDTYQLKIRYLGKQEVKTMLGKVDSYILAPIMPKNELFNGENSIKVFVSSDKNRIPVIIQAQMFVGAVEIELQNYKNLKHKLNFK